MAMKIRWTKPFGENLEAARAYIAEEDPQAARQVIRRILDVIEVLRQFPEAGRLEAASGARIIAVTQTPFVMAYRVHEETIALLSLWHHAQKWPL